MPQASISRAPSTDWEVVSRERCNGITADDLAHVTRHAEHLRNGSHLIAVAATQEADRHVIARAIAQTGGREINYFSSGYVETL